MPLLLLGSYMQVAAPVLSNITPSLAESWHMIVVSCPVLYHLQQARGNASPQAPLQQLPDPPNQTGAVGGALCRARGGWHLTGGRPGSSRR